jgi:hypothetical protein
MIDAIQSKELFRSNETDPKGAFCVTDQRILSFTFGKVEYKISQNGLWSWGRPECPKALHIRLQASALL